MAVPPDLVGFTEAAGVAAVGFGPEAQSILDAHREFWTCFFSHPWRVRDLITSRLEISGPLLRGWQEMSTTLVSLADGADLIFTGINFEDAAANVAEYYDIPLATLHYFPLRPNGQTLPFLPAPMARSAVTAFWWSSWRATKKVEDAQRRELGLPKAKGSAPRRITDRGSLEIQAYDEACFPGLADEWAEYERQRPFVGTPTLGLATEADEEVASWIAAGTPPIYFGFGSIPVESPADTIAMIGAACARLGERALVGAAGTDFSSVPRSDHVKVVGAVNFSTVFPACRAVVHHGGTGTTAIGLRAGVPHADPFDGHGSDALGISGQTTEGGYRSALFHRYREIAGRGFAHHPRPGLCRPRPRARHPDDRTRQERRGRRRSPGRLRPLAACWLIGAGHVLPIATCGASATTAGAPITDSRDSRLSQQVWSRTCYTHVEYWSGDAVEQQSVR